jgi:hypothetical protein
MDQSVVATFKQYCVRRVISHAFRELTGKVDLL